MKKHKVLSHSKLHKYLKMFSDMGFLIRERLPKRGNYVEYHLNLALASQHPFWCHFFIRDRSYSDDYGPQLFDIPLLIKSRFEMRKWLSKKRIRKKLQTNFEEYMRPMRFLVTTENRRYLNKYQLLHDLTPHKPLETMKIIMGLKQQRFCPNCLKEISLQKYLQEGVDCISKLILVKEENEVYCSKCYYKEWYKPLSY